MGSIGIYAGLANDVQYGHARAHKHTLIHTQPDAHIAVLMGWGTVRLSCIRLEDEMVHMGATHQTHTQDIATSRCVCYSQF